jgi:hypothetical protein
MENKRVINRVYVKNELGEIFILDNGDKNRWTNSFENFSDSKEIISERMFELINKYGHIYFPIGVKTELEPGVHTVNVEDDKSNKEILIKVEKDFSVIKILEEIKAIKMGEFAGTAGDNRNALFSMIKLEVSKSEKLRKKVVLEIIEKFKNIVFSQQTIGTIRNFLGEFSNFELLIVGSVESEITSIREDIFNNEKALFMAGVFNASPVLKRIDLNYEYLRDLLDFRISFLGTRLFDRYDREEDSIGELFFMFAMRFTKELDKDVDFKNKIKNKLNFSYLSLNIGNFFSITKMTNKNVILLDKVMRECFESFTTFEPMIAMEFYRRNLLDEAHASVKEKEPRETQKNLITLMNHMMNVDVRNKGERAINQFVFEKYKEAFTTTRREAMAFVDENNLRELLNIVKDFSVNTNTSSRESFNIFFSNDSDLESMNFIKDSDILRRKILIKSQLEIFDNDSSIESKYRFSKNEIQNIKYSEINSVYLKFYCVMRTFEGEYEHLTEDQVSGINREFFRSLASSNTSERKNLVRMLSLFLHFASHQVSEFASDEELDKRIKIIIKEMSNSTLRNGTIASILNNPNELYKDSPYDYRVKNAASDTILGKEYSHISQLIQDETGIRDIVKSTILLNILN